VVAAELSRLLERTAPAAFAVDDEGLICAWNRAAERLLGYSASQTLRNACASLLRGRSTLDTNICGESCRIMDCALRGQEIPRFEMEVRARSGRRAWLGVFILVFQDDRTGGHVVVHILDDISHTKRRDELAAKLVRAAQQLSSLSEVAAPLPPALALTQREGQLLRLLAQGKTTAVVSRELRISPGTLRNHLYHINEKLLTHSRVEAIMQAKRRGII